MNNPGKKAHVKNPLKTKHSGKLNIERTANGDDHSGFLITLDEGIDRTAPIGNFLSEGIEVLIIGTAPGKFGPKIQLSISAHKDITVLRSETSRKPRPFQPGDAAVYMPGEVNFSKMGVIELIDCIATIRDKIILLEKFETELREDIMRCKELGYQHKDNSQHVRYINFNAEYGRVIDQRKQYRNLKNKAESHLVNKQKAEREEQNNRYLSIFYGLCKEEFKPATIEKLQKRASALVNETEVETSAEEEIPETS